MPEWKADEEFLRREREIVERRANSPAGRRWRVELAKNEQELAQMDPASKEAADLRWWLGFRWRMYGCWVRPVE